MKKKLWKNGFCVLAVALSLTAQPEVYAANANGSTQAQTAAAQTQTTAAQTQQSAAKKVKAKKANKWEKNSKGFYSYYNSSGKRLRI